MFVATLIAAGKLTDEVVREGIDRLAATGHDVVEQHAQRRPPHGSRAGAVLPAGQRMNDPNR